MRQLFGRVVSSIAAPAAWVCSIIATLALGLVACASALGASGDAVSQELAVRIGPRLLLVSVGGGHRRVAAEMPAWVTFTPDGNSIVYTGSNGQARGASLFVQALDGKRRRLTRPVVHGRLAAEDTQAAVSPDGKLVAFIRDRQLGSGRHRESLLVVPLAGGTPRTLRQIEYGHGDPPPIVQAAWSPDGTTLAVVVNRRVLLLSATGDLLRVLSQQEAVANSTLAWSPDGREIAVAAGIHADIDVQPQPSEQLQVLPITEGTPRTLLTCRLGCTSPAWSPDGKSIAIADDTGPDGPIGPVLAIRILDAQTGAIRWSSNPRQLYLRDGPTWSPDSRYLAFSRLTTWMPYTPRSDTTILDTTTRRVFAIPDAFPFAWR